MFISPEQEGWKIANNLKSDYIVIYVVGQKLPAFDPISKSPLFVLGGGGDESKKMNRNILNLIYLHQNQSFGLPF